MAQTQANGPGIEALQQTAAFAAAGRRGCAMLAVQALEHIYAKGEIIFSEDSRAEALFIVARGALRLTRRAASGGSVVLREQGAPAVILTTGLFDRGLICATATALTECTAYRLSRDPFIHFCHDHPEVAIHVLSEIGGHLRRTSGFIDLITAGGTGQRLARVLLELMEEAGSARFALPCSQSELAMRLGTVRELIHRNLKLMEARGVLRFEGKHIEITNAPALASAAGVPAGASRVFESRGAPPFPGCFVLAPAGAAHHAGVQDQR